MNCMIVSVVWIVADYVTIFVGVGCEGRFGGHARVATIRFHSRADTFMHMSFVLSVLNFSSVLNYVVTILHAFLNYSLVHNNNKQLNVIRCHKMNFLRHSTPKKHQNHRQHRATNKTADKGYNVTARYSKQTTTRLTRKREICIITKQYLHCDKLQDVLKVTIKQSRLERIGAQMSGDVQSTGRWQQTSS